MKRLPEPKIYKHQQLIDEYNEMMIRIKVHLFELNNLKTSDKISPLNFPKPTVQELDELMNKIITVLSKDNKPMILRK
jgi:hypothetical protein